MLYGETEHTVTGLMADTEYGFGVLVFPPYDDRMTHATVYTDEAEARTDKLVDNTPPTFPGGARVKVDEVTETSVKISWPKATDDRTPQNKIRYTIYKNWKYNYSIGIDVDSHTFDLLAQDTKYNFQVYAIDEAGNWSRCLDTTIKTKKKVVPDTEPPYFPNGQELSVTATETSLKVSWPAAADKVTATNNLLYKTHFSPSSEETWPKTVLGKNVLSHTFTGLQPDTEYDISVTVCDEAANSADYKWKMQVKTKASDKTVHPASVSIAPTSLDLEAGNKATLTATAGTAKATCQVTVTKEEKVLAPLDVQISGSINHTTYTAGESGYVTFNRFPASVEEFKMVREQIGTEPHGAIALQVMAYEMYRRDKKIGEVCIRLNNTISNISLPISRLKELFGGDNSYNRPYQMAAFLKGANPENGYNPTKPYTVEVTVDPGLKYVKTNDFQSTILHLRIKSEGRLLSSKQGFDQVAVLKTKKRDEPSQGTYFIVQSCGGLYFQMAPISFDAEFKGLE